jgi:hypothetical protein
MGGSPANWTSGKNYRDNFGIMDILDATCLLDFQEEIEEEKYRLTFTAY